MGTRCLATLILLGSAGMADAQEHPRLFFAKSDLPALRAKIGQEPFKSMVERLRSHAEVGAWGDGPVETALDEILCAHRCGFLYALTGEDAWARKAREWVEKRRADTAVWGNPSAKGLTLYTHGVYLATTYDWCFGAPSWDATFCKIVSETLRKQADVIFRKGGTAQNRNPASNWQGLRWSSAGLCMLAGDEGFSESELEACFSRVCRYLVENLGRGGSGWNCEGLGYTYYPMANGVCPFGVAMARHNPARDIRQATPAAPWTLWTVYAATVATRSGLWHPDFVDDNPAARAEGTMGFAFWMCPREIHPALKWWYDRTVGIEGDRTFDGARFGTVASILFYPGDEVTAQDPMTLEPWRARFADARGGNGMFTFRNAYRGPDDIVVQIYAKLRGDRGHSGPDSLSYRMCGLDGLWAVGGGRYGVKTGGQEVYWRSQNTVYPGHPDGRLSINSETGRVVAHQSREDGGGWVVMAAARNNVGTVEHTRRLAVDFSSRSGAAAAILIVDTSRNGRFWQHVTIEYGEVTVSDRTFTMVHPDGNTLTGTVLYPPNTELRTGRRPRGSKAGAWDENLWVTASSPDGSFVVVLTLQKKGQKPPTISAQGTWTGIPQGVVTVGQLAFRVEGDRVSME